MSARVRIPLRARMVPLLVLAAGCVTTSTSESPVQDLALTAITIPLQSSGSDPRARAVDQYYQSILVQLQNALLERNPELIFGLIEQHTRAGAPAWALEQMTRFRNLADGLRFELHVEATGSVSEVGGPRALGEELSLVLRIPPSTDPAIRLFGPGEAEVPARFVTSLRVLDHDCYGSRSKQVFNEIISLPKGADFGAGEYVGQPVFEHGVSVRCDLQPVLCRE